MITPDLINGLYESVGGLLLAKNCYHLYKDKKVRGVSVFTTGFFASWGYWNLYYYPHLNQWLSFVGGLLIVFFNTLWVLMALYYNKSNHLKFKNDE